MGAVKAHWDPDPDPAHPHWMVGLGLGTGGEENKTFREGSDPVSSTGGGDITFCFPFCVSDKNKIRADKS